MEPVEKRRIKFMSYTANLNDYQSLAIANQDVQTILTLRSNSPQQQQSQSSSFTTGVWQTPPRLYRLGTSFILQLTGDRGLSYILIQVHSISTIATPVLDDAVEVKLHQVDDSENDNRVEFEPMQPMQPMKLGNMSMDINSMSMQMGNMSLNMGNVRSTNSTSTKLFCSQCGQKAKASDRFCSSCGHKLDK
jgi:hypothetical protein